MKPEEVENMLAEALSKQSTEFNTQLDGVKTDFQNKLNEKDEVINGLKTTISDLKNSAATASIESIVDAFIAEGRVSPANRALEIENLQLREGKDSFETYKNSIANRERVVDMVQNFAAGGVPRNDVTNIDADIEKILNDAGKTVDTATQEEYMSAANTAHKKGGK